MSASKFTTCYRFINELVWLPTYLVTFLIIDAAIGNAAINWLVSLFAIVIERAVLEIIYRIIFGDSRLRFSIGMFAFISQVAIYWLIIAINSKQAVHA